MGVEYKHFLIPNDPSFVPEKHIIEKIDKVLNKWNLRTGIPKVYDLTNGINTIVVAPLDGLDFGQGLAIEYPGVEGDVVNKIMGESYYHGEASEANRYIERFTFIVGLDYRIHPSSQELSLTVIKPPLEGSIAIDPYCEGDDFLHYGLHAESYTCYLTTTPPVVDISVIDKKRIIGDQNFLGF